MLKRIVLILLIFLLIVRVSYSAPGILDPTFGQNGVIVYNGPANWYDRGNGVAIQSDGKIVVTGYTFNGKNFDVLLLRYNSDGTLDETFGTGGVVTYNGSGNGCDYGNGVTIQPDGKIVVIGFTSTGPLNWDIDLLVLRYNIDGSLDTTFGTNGVVTYDGYHFEDIAYDVAIQQDGKIVITGCSVNISGGHDSEILVLRYNNDGTLDNTFGFNGVVKYDYMNLEDCGYGVAIQQDGKIVVTGYTSHPNYKKSLIILRLNADGTLDSTFGNGGVVMFDDLSDEIGFDVAIQSDGKIIVAGYTSDSSRSDLIVLRYREDGLLDSTFGEGGIAKYNSKKDGVINNEELYEAALTLQPNGKIVVTGYHFNGINNDVLVLRYNNDGTLDLSFGENGVFTYNGPTNNNDNGIALAIQNDGKIVITGVTYTGTPYPSDVLTLRLLGGDPPGVATLISPSGTITNTTPTYIWNAVPESTKYYLWVEDFTGPKVQQWYTAEEAGCDTGTCSVTPNIVLSPGAYQWKIQTSNLAGDGPWSSPVLFTIESVSSPNIPIGSANGIIGTSYSYSVSGATSSAGHPVQYLFDWGDGTNSGWLPIGQTSASKSWASQGTYNVRARARCANHTSIISPWSDSLKVNILPSPIILQSPANGEVFNSCTLINPYQPTFSWAAIGTFTNYSILFSSSDTDFSTRGILIYKTNIRGTNTSWTPAIGVWKKIMTLSDNNGNIRNIYWKIVGTMPNRSTVESEVRSFCIGTPQSASIISPQEGVKLPFDLPPTFEFNSNCNVKFRLEFSSSNDSWEPKTTKGFTFTTKDPKLNTPMTRTLTRGEWNAVRKLLGNGGYFRIKAWDAVKRETISDVKSFGILSSLIGSWNVTGTLKVTVTIFGLGSKSSTEAFQDEFIFREDMSFQMNEMNGTWNENWNIFTVVLSLDDIESYFEENLEYALGVPVDLKVVEGAFNGKENWTNGTISGKITLVMNMYIPLYGLEGTIKINTTFNGAKIRGIQASILKGGWVEGSRTFFKAIGGTLTNMVQSYNVLPFH